MVEKKRTIFCDIDGTIFKYRKFETIKTTKSEFTPEDLRDHTVRELLTMGVPWDKLVMGIERGPRYLINDMDPAKSGLRAIAYSIERDRGLKKVVVGATEEIHRR